MNHRLRTVLRGATAMAVIVALAGCSKVQTSSPSASASGATTNYGSKATSSEVRQGGELVFGLSADPDALDPATSTALVAKHVFASICESLYSLDTDGKIVPQLATKTPTISDSGKKYVIPLRTDVKFADGTPMNATAVAKSLQRNIDLPTSQRKSELGPVKTIKATDASHVEVTFSKAYAPFAAALADRPGMIVSPTAVAKEGDAFGANPVCAGPFKFDGRVANTSITVVKDSNYYDASAVHLDKIVYRITPDANVRAANAESGSVQVADTLSPQDMSAVTKAKGVKVLQASTLGFQGIHINLANANGVGEKAGKVDSTLASSKLVRQAFSYAVDRKALAQAVFKGWFSSACGPISPTSPYSTASDQKCRDANPSKAKALLKKAGVSTPVKVELKVANQQDPLRYAQALQSEVKESGFDVEIKPVEFATLLQDVATGNYQAALLGWAGRPDPDGNISIYMSSTGSSNYTGYSNSKVDSLITKAAETTKVSKRASLYSKAISIANDDVPYVYLYRQRTLVAEHGVTGVTIDQAGVIHPEFAGFLKD